MRISNLPLLFCALLVPVVAYALTTTLTVQVVPQTPSGTIACDYGPSYNGQIPAGAQAAGFTHCAVNLDFTQSRFSSLSNFIDCFGASGPQSTPILYHNTIAGSNVPCDGNHYAIVADGPYSQVFKPTWLLSDGNNINNLYSATATNFPAYNGFTIPNGQFIEWVFRIASVNICTSNCLMYGPFEYPWPGDSNPFIEYDIAEIYSGPGGTNQFVSVNAINPIYTTPYDPTNYHTYGFRVTADGNGNIAHCNYYSSTVVNGLPSSAFLSCRSESRSGTGTQRQGFFNTWGPNPPTTGVFNGNLVVYLVRETIWECPGWNDDHSHIFLSSTQCNGTVLTTGP